MKFIKYFTLAVDIFVTTINEWLDDKAFSMAAALSFYSLMSLAPFMFVITALAGFIFEQQVVTGQVVTSINNYAGSQSADLIQSLIANANIPKSGTVATVASVCVFVWAALSVFIETRDSLNTIWGVKIKSGKGFKEFFIGRIFSLLIIILIGLLIVISLITGTLLNMADAILHDFIGDNIPLIRGIDIFISFILITFLFAVIMKYLPSVNIEWTYVLIGAIIISLLFNLGKYIIGYFLSKSIYLSLYGAAGSLVILLFWIYYSSLISFFGAELTQVIRKKFARKPLEYGDNVLKITKISEQVEGPFLQS